MIYVGTSGWQYRDWRGPFYPEKLPQRSWLQHYATRFPVVEVNNSFYMLPKEETFDRWRQSTPDGFGFVVKASRYITHIRRLRDPKDPVDLFWSRARRLGPKLGPVLFQLPPNFPADEPLLEDFLHVLPKQGQAAVEFRDPSWETDRVYAILDRARAALVLPDRPGARIDPVVTGGWSYVRFHKGRATHPAYTRGKLRRWADRIAAMDARDVWCFFNNDAWAAAPADAETLMELLGDRGLNVARAPAAQPTVR
jgi:uncharacterized protein YecE (DUF72 family)